MLCNHFCCAARMVDMNCSQELCINLGVLCKTFSLGEFIIVSRFLCIYYVYLSLITSWVIHSLFRMHYVVFV